MLANKSVFISGGTGSFGQKFADYIIKKYPTIKKIVIFSRDEFKQHLMKERLKNNKLFNKFRFFLEILEIKKD